MTKIKFFYIGLIVIYLVFLMKDNLFKMPSNLESLKDNMVNNKAEFYEKEYKNLSELLNMEVYNYDIIYSRVVLRNIYDFFNKITILKGSNDNLSIGDIVVNEKGLVGVISKVDNNYSEVSLLTSSNTDLSVKINDSYGILTSTDNKLIVKNVKLNKEIKEGEKVYTSGLTLVPDGILVGIVNSVSKDDLGLEYIIEVMPVVDFYTLNYIGVISS